MEDFLRRSPNLFQGGHEDTGVGFFYTDFFRTHSKVQVGGEASPRTKLSQITPEIGDYSNFISSLSKFLKSGDRVVKRHEVFGYGQGHLPDPLGQIHRYGDAGGFQNQLLVSAKEFYPLFIGSFGKRAIFILTIEEHICHGISAGDVILLNCQTKLATGGLLYLF